jgi:tetratricopeptide (TPR) repeat protein
MDAEWLAELRPAIMALGALLLVAGSLLTVASHRWRAPADGPPASALARAEPIPPRGPAPAAPAAAPAAAPPAETNGAGWAGRPALAVPPFAAATLDPAGAQRLAGLHETILALLRRGPDLALTGRQALAAAAAADPAPLAIAQAVRAGYVLSGEVADGASLRLRLLAMATGAELWHGEAALADAPDGELAARLADALADALWRAETARTRPPPAAGRDARALLQRVGTGFTAFDQRRFHEMEGHARQAIELDPDNAAAHGMLAGALALKAYQAWTIRPAADLAEALRLAERAMVLAPGDGRIRYWSALVHFCGGQTAAALEQVAAAIELEAAFAPAQALQGAALILQGSASSGLASIGRALTQAPHHAHAFRFHLWRGVGLAELGNRAPAQQAFRQSIELNPVKDPVASADACWAALGLAGARAMQGQTDEARAALARLQARMPDDDLDLIIDRAGRSFAPKVRALAIVRALAPLWPRAEATAAEAAAG